MLGYRIAAMQTVRAHMYEDFIVDVVFEPRWLTRMLGGTGFVGTYIGRYGWADAVTGEEVYVLSGLYDALNQHVRGEQARQEYSAYLDAEIGR